MDGKKPRRRRLRCSCDDFSRYYSIDTSRSLALDAVVGEEFLFREGDINLRYQSWLVVVRRMKGGIIGHAYQTRLTWRQASSDKRGTVLSVVTTENAAFYSRKEYTVR